MPIVAVDANFLPFIVNPELVDDASIALNPIKESRSIQIASFLHSLNVDSNSKIIIPTPVLAEVLVVMDSAIDFVEDIKKNKVFKIAPFDVLAAIELSQIDKLALAAGDKRSGSLSPWQKIKVDRQIVAIAKVNRVRIIYSNDADLKLFGEQQGIPVLNFGDIPIIPELSQTRLDLVTP